MFPSYAACSTTFLSFLMLSPPICCGDVLFFLFPSQLIVHAFPLSAFKLADVVPHAAFPWRCSPPLPQPGRASPVVTAKSRSDPPLPVFSSAKPAPLFFFFFSGPSLAPEPLFLSPPRLVKSCSCIVSRFRVANRK